MLIKRIQVTVVCFQQGIIDCIFTRIFIFSSKTPPGVRLSLYLCTHGKFSLPAERHMPCCLRLINFWKHSSVTRTGPPCPAALKQSSALRSVFPALQLILGLSHVWSTSTLHPLTPQPIYNLEPFRLNWMLPTPQLSKATAWPGHPSVSAFFSSIFLFIFFLLHTLSGLHRVDQFSGVNGLDVQ